MSKLQKIECVVTCVNYSDFLAHTLPHNRSQFDNMVVVTTPEDKETQRVCEFWHVRCVQTNRFDENASFRKGAGINVGLDLLKKDGWLVHMDADILLPPLFRKIVLDADLDQSFIYGADRFMCKSFEDWQAFIQKPRVQQENNIFVHTNAFDVGTRIYKPQEGGYIPIGFFQMWHGSIGANYYPEEHTDAGRGDVLFALQWPRSKRAFIPEIICYHLESEPCEMGANWSGRRTKVFAMDQEKLCPKVMPAPPEFNRRGFMEKAWEMFLEFCFYKKY